MNKRISTLMASVLLASAFSANAAGNLKVGDFVRLHSKPVSTDLYVGIEIDASGLPTGKLTNGGEFVDLTNGVTGVMTEAEKLAKVQSNLDKAKAQIWKVAKVTTTDGGLKSYQFTNKLTNEYLAIDLGTANNAGANASLKASGNKDWYIDAGGHLYVYKSSVDSTYSLGESAGRLTITREQGSTPSGLAFDLDNSKNPAVTVDKALVWNGLMSAKGHDGKLHFNDQDVTSSYTNILKDTKWTAVKENGDAYFFLTNGQKTPINKNPYMLMVDYDSYDLSKEYFKLTTDTLTVPKTGATGTSAEAVAGGTYVMGNYSFPEAAGTAVDKLVRPIDAALWNAEYYLLNDSISLTPKGLPKKNNAVKDYISDGFSVLKAVTSGSNVGAANTNVAGNAGATTVSGSDGDTGTALDILIAAVTDWIGDTKAGKSGETFPSSSGLKKTFAQTRFVPAGTVATTPDASPASNEKKGSDLIAAAKDQLANTTATTTGPVTETVLAEAKKYVEAVTYLRRVVSGETPEKYFERGVVHQPANTSSTGYAVALVKALSERVLSVAATASDANASAPLIQPYVSAPAGDAEITADAKLFFIQVKNTTQMLRATSETDKYIVSYTNSTKEVVDYVDNANPNAQWVFVPNAAGSYSIINRATEFTLYSGMVQKVKDAAGNVVADTYVIGTDTLKLGAVTVNTDAVYEEKDGDDKVKYDYAGYFYAGPQNGKTMTFGIAPVSPFMSTLAMQVKADSTVVLGEAENAPVWYFDKVEGEAYGVNITGMPRLKSVAYKVYMKDADGKKYYIVPNAGTKTFVITKEDSPVGSAYATSTTAGLIFRTVAKDTYLISNGTAAGNYKMTINSTPEQPIIEATANSDNLKNDYFTVGKASSNTYRTLTAEDGVNGNAAIYLNNEDSRYLYENSANIVANNGTKFAKDSLNFLGIFNAFELDKNPTVYVDTAYVEREGNIMPQYMFALGVEDVKAHAAIPCTEGGVHIDKDGKPTTADKCVHATPATKGYKAGRYLVVLADSTENNKSAKYDGATRLAFVPAKHYLGEDSLVIDNSKWTGNTNAIEAGKDKTWASKDTIKIENGTLKAMTFALEIKDQADKSFYLQTKDGYVRILNGVPVLTSKKDDAAVFNIEASELEATANEAIEAAGVQVIGGQGVVTVQGAAGKVITVADILGRTIANQVAASDNVTIAAPAGVVVVAVDGDATKVVVK